MAQNKKVFSIIINGVSESVDAVKSLNSQLDDLERRIKVLQDAKIDIKVSGGQIENEPTKTKVSGGKQSGVDAEAKLAKQLEAEKAKAVALTNEEYKKQLQELNQIKAANKDIQDTQKDIAKGVLDINGNYANTLAGQRALLGDLKKQLANTELGTDDWEELGKKVLQVNENVKKLEESYGVFTRSVGNYEKAAKGFKDLEDGTREYQNSIAGLTQKIADFTDKLAELEGGSDEFKDMAEQITEAKNALSQLEAATDTAGNAMENKLGIKFTTTINGVEYAFDDVNQGVGLLEDKLYQLANAGKQNTKEFKAIQAEVIRLKNVVIQTDAAIDGMVGTSKGLKNVMSIIGGFTGFASIGQGISSLFGGQNTELDESIQKFAALSLIMQGLEATQKELNNSTSMFGKYLNPLADKLKSVSTKMSEAFDNTKVGKFFKDLFAATQVHDDIANKLYETYSKLYESFGKIISESSVLSDAFSKLNDEDLSHIFEFDYSGSEDLNKMSDEFKDYYDAVSKAAEANPEFAKTLSDNRKEWTKSKREVAQYASSLRGAGNNSKKLGFLLPKVAKGIKAVTVTLKSLAKATVVLALVQLAVEAISKLFEGLGWVYGKFEEIAGVNDIVIDSTTTLTKKIEVETKRWKELNDELERASKLKQLSIFDKLDQQLSLMDARLKSTGKQLKDFIDGIEYLNEKVELESGSGFWSVGFADIETLEEFRSEYDKLLKAITESKDRVEAGGKGWGWWNTEQDAMEDFVNMQKEAIRIMAQELSKIDFSDPEKAAKEFRKVMDDEMYASAFANIDELFPDEAWAKTLKVMVDTYSKAVDDMKSKTDELEDANAKAQEDITKNNIAAIKDRHERERKELEKQRDDEIKAANGNAALIQSIKDKYAVKERDLIARQQTEIRKINEGIQANYIAAMKDGLKKRIKELEHARQVEIDSARDTNIKVNEQIASINAKYNKLISDAKYDYYKDLEEKTKARNEVLINLELGYAREIEDIQNQIAQMMINNNRLIQENSEIGLGSKVTFDSSSFESIKQYYDIILNLQKEALEKRMAIERSQAELEGKMSIEAENRRYADQEKAIKTNLDNQLKTLDESLRNQEITQEEYNQRVQQLNNISNQQSQNSSKQHQEMLAQIQTNTENTLTNIVKNGNEERKNITATAANEISSAYQEILDSDKVNIDVDDDKYKNMFGFIKTKTLKKDLKTAQSTLQEGMDSINQQMLDNKQKYEKGEISFVDFNANQKSLEDMKKNTSKSLEDITENLNNFSMASAQNIASTISNYMQQFGAVFSMFNDVMMQEYENQQAELDRQKEILEEEEDQLEEHYQKQQEITKKYTDKINGIEDELKNARGERRQHLLDQLAAQTDGQLQSLAKEKEIEKEKQENEKKKEALKKKQDQLDKKRKQQEKLNSIIQATINTSVAVTNALAVQPWFVGVALAATAAALGIAQIAKIKAAKYANGGVINGKSHAQGGVPVLGGQAEVEGGEFITNKETTDKNRELLYYTNSIKRPITLDDMERFYSKKTKVSVPKSSTHFADGGELPEMYDINIKKAINSGAAQDNRPIVVSVVDIVNKSDNLREVKTLAGL